MPVYDFPSGTIVPHGSSVVPATWVPCDGTAYDGTNSRYAALWAVIGTTYGGTGQASFRVPNLGSRVPVGPKSGAQVAITNPSFATDTTGWTAGTESTPSSGSTITRDTSVFHSSPASGRWDNTGASNNVDFGDTIRCALTGTFVAGTSYTLTWRMRANSPANAWLYAYLGDLTTTNYQFRDFVNGFTAGAWNTCTISWVPSVNTSGATFMLNDRSAFFGGSSYYWIDSLTITSTDGDGGLGTWYGGTAHQLTAAQSPTKAHNHVISYPATHDHGGSATSSYSSHTHTVYVTAASYDNKNTNASINAFVGGSGVAYTTTNSTGLSNTASGASASGGWTVTNYSATNASAAHSNIQPELALNYIIKL